MAYISMTDFVDFTRKAGSPKSTFVEDVRSRGEYSPATDFWKRLREGIRHLHESAGSIDDLSTIGVQQTNASKKKLYPLAIKAYLKFLNDDPPSAWFDPPHAEWVRHGLHVRVNPEIGLTYADGRMRVIKLYFKEEKLTKYTTAAALELLHVQLRPLAPQPIQIGLLDVRRSRFYTAPASETHAALLDGEAYTFMTLWNAGV